MTLSFLNVATLQHTTRFLSFVFLVGIAGYVVFYTCFQTYLYHTAIPQWDEWRLLSKYQAFLNGEGSFIKFLWSLHNEHRVLVPRIIMISDIELFNGAGFLPKFIMFFVITLYLVIFVRIIAQYVNGPFLLKVLLSSGITVIFFSSQQMENFIRGFNHQVFLVTFLSTLSLYSFRSAKIAFDDNKEGVKGYYFFVFSIVCACLSTYSMSGGILTWPLLVFYAWCMRVRRVLVFVIITISMVCIATYLWHYSTPVHHSDPLKTINHVTELVVFAIMFLGNIVGMFGPQASFITGLLGMLIFSLFIFGYIVRRDKIPDHILLLILISSFTVVISFIVGLGRLKFGIEYGISSRYVTFTSPFWASVIIMAFSSPKEFGFNSGLPKLLLTILVVLLFSAVVIRQNHLEGLAQSEFMKHERGGMALFSHAPDKEVLGGLYPELSTIERVSVLLSAKHIPPYTEKWQYFVDSARGLFTEEHANNGDWCMGYIDVITPLYAKGDSKKWNRVEGWAWNKKQHSSPDMILLADSKSPAGVAKVFLRRDDVKHNISDVITNRVGWFGYSYNHPEQVINAYAFSEQQSALCKLSSSINNVQ